MKTLRAKLFTSIGAVLLLAGILNTLSAEMWIKKDLNKASSHINNRFEEMQEQIRKFASFLLTFHIVQEATELGRVVQTAGNNSLPSQDLSSLWKKAGTVLSYNPDIAFIQIQNKEGKHITLAPEDVHLRSFSWAFDKEHTLWIKINGEKTLFEAKPFEDFYLLFETQNLSMPLHFTEVSVPSYSYNWQDSASNLFLSLLSQKNQWLQKMELIQELLPWKEKDEASMPFGIIKIDPQKKSGACLLTKNLFPENLLVPYSPLQEEDVPALILRTTPHGKELDMVKSLSFPNSQGAIITLGFSLSSLLGEISLLTQKTIIATGENFSIGFTPLGKTIEVKDAPSTENPFTWNGHSYVVSTIDLSVLKVFLLTPLEQATATSRFLEALNHKIVDTISLSLIGAALFSFLVALLLLNNLSKKITEPIAILSKAAKTLGSGSYSHLVLPQIQHRQDEVATLARSFEGMVSALKDRDKIQGLLNKVVSKEICQKILEQNIELGGEEKVVTLLFSDIRNFTQLSEELPPHILIDILNAYMTRMCHIIDETHGVVDKFIGDEIMTLYGAPVALDFHAVKAIDAALSMIEDLSFWNKEREKSNSPTFEIGIGIHTGLVYTGNMGAENRLNYTAIGANVNQASRICSVAKPMQILISEDTLKSPGVEERFHVQKLEPVLLKGIQHPVQIYEVISLKV